MRRILIFLFFLDFVVLLVPAASAHILQSDGAITVLLHTSPDDDPIVGQPAGLLFEVTDSSNKFDPEKCGCNIQITENGKQLLNSPLYHVSGASSIYGFTMPFTFSDRDIYTITITGTPQTSGQFQPFTVSYNLRVARQENEQAHPATQNASASKDLPWPYVAIGGAVVAAGIIYLATKIIK